MKNRKSRGALRDFYLLWSTQSLSQLGSSATAFALTLWLYQTTGSALGTAALTICSYAPYVLMSIFAGALTDRFDKKKTMLVCDALAAACTVLVFVLYKTNSLAVWHLYAINAFSGLMNTVQSPAAEVATTLLTPREYDQRTGGLLSLSRSLISILNPLIAAALYGLAGLELVIAVDLLTFVPAFVTLAAFIKIPKPKVDPNAGVMTLAKEGIAYLKATPMILTLILFMSGVNLVASAFDAVLPALVLPVASSSVLGIVTSSAGLAMVAGSLLVSVLPAPKDRVRVVYWTMVFSMGTENFLLAFSRSPAVWCVGQVLGWFVVPIMSANLTVILRKTIPTELQGRVYACRNTLQFFTIPIGLLLGGLLVDNVCEPYMAAHADSAFLTALFGSGKGSGAALVMFLLGVTGFALCVIVGQRLKRYHFNDQEA